MAGQRADLTDFQWPAIAPELARTGRGAPWRDERRIPNGASRVLRSGAPRRQGPARHGENTTVHSRFNRRRKAGGWARITVARGDADGGDAATIDSSDIRVREHAAHPKRGIPIGRESRL